MQNAIEMDTYQSDSSELIKTAQNNEMQSIHEIQSNGSQENGESIIDITHSKTQSIESNGKRNGPVIIAYRILVHLLLLYAVCGVTYLLLKDTECSCSDNAIASTNTISDDATYPP